MRRVEAAAFPYMADRARKDILRSLKNALARRRGKRVGQLRNSTPEDFAALGIPVVYVNPDGTPKE
jgi:hypothetical protein